MSLPSRYIVMFNLSHANLCWTPNIHSIHNFFDFSKHEIISFHSTQPQFVKFKDIFVMYLPVLLLNNSKNNEIVFIYHEVWYYLHFISIDNWNKTMKVRKIEVKPQIISILIWVLSFGLFSEVNFDHFWPILMLL